MFVVYASLVNQYHAYFLYHFSPILSEALSLSTSFAYHLFASKPTFLLSHLLAETPFSPFL